MRGYLDHVSRTRIFGWAIDEANLDIAVRVVVFVNGAILTRAVANRYRADLETVFGNGRHSFDIYVPGLDPFHRHLVTVRIEGSDEDLENAPVVIEPSNQFDDEAETTLRRMVASADEAALERTALAFAEGIETILDQRARLHSHEVLRHFKHRWFKHRGPAPAERAPEPPLRALIITASSSSGDVESATRSQALSLRRLGYDVSLVRADLSRPSDPDANEFGRAGVVVHHLPFTASVEELLRRQQGTFNVVIVHTLANAMHYLPMARSYCSNARLLFSRSLVFENLTVGPSPARPRLVDLVEHQRVAALTSAWQVDVVLSQSLADAARISEVAPSARVHVVHQSVKLRPTTISFEQRRGVLFLGLKTLLRIPELRQLIMTVMNDVWSGDPDIVCLVHDAMDADVADFVERRMIAVGGDTSQLDELDRVRLSVILTNDHNARRTIAESLASGIPCIAPVAVLREMGAPTALEVCDTERPADIAEAILRLHGDADYNRSLRKIGLDFVDAHYSEVAADAALAAALSKRGGAIRAALKQGSSK